MLCANKEETHRAKTGRIIIPPPEIRDHRSRRTALGTCSSCGETLGSIRGRISCRRGGGISWSHRQGIISDVSCVLSTLRMHIGTGVSFVDLDLQIRGIEEPFAIIAVIPPRIKVPRGWARID